MRIRDARYSVAAAVIAAAASTAGADEAARLTRIVRHDCGACHGLTLKGGLGPPLTREALVGRPQPYVVTTILDGIKGTAMPPWSPLLTEGEAAWIAHRLIGGFPDAD